MFLDFFKKRQGFDYIANFVYLSRFSLEAAEFLVLAMKNITPEQLKKDIVSLHKIEQNADKAKREMMDVLVKEFLPPIDKDDIIILSHQIDTVTDSIDEALAFIGAHGITVLPPDVHTFADLVTAACLNTNQALKAWAQGEEVSFIWNYLQQVNSIKSQALVLYVESLKNVYKTTQDPLEIMVYTELFKLLEACCQECKKVTNTVERIIIKNL